MPNTSPPQILTVQLLQPTESCATVCNSDDVLIAHYYIDVYFLYFSEFSDKYLLYFICAFSQ